MTNTTTTAVPAAALMMSSPDDMLDRMFGWTDNACNSCTNPMDVTRSTAKDDHEDEDATSPSSAPPVAPQGENKLDYICDYHIEPAMLTICCCDDNLILMNDAALLQKENQPQINVSEAAKAALACPTEADDSDNDDDSDTTSRGKHFHCTDWKARTKGPEEDALEDSRHYLLKISGRDGSNWQFYRMKKNGTAIITKGEKDDPRSVLAPGSALSPSSTPPLDEAAETDVSSTEGDDGVDFNEIDNVSLESSSQPTRSRNEETPVKIEEVRILLSDAASACSSTNADGGSEVDAAEVPSMAEKVILSEREKDLSASETDGVGEKRATDDDAFADKTMQTAESEEAQDIPATLASTWNRFMSSIQPILESFSLDTPNSGTAEDDEKEASEGRDKEEEATHSLSFLEEPMAESVKVASSIVDERTGAGYAMYNSVATSMNLTYQPIAAQHPISCDSESVEVLSVGVDERTDDDYAMYSSVATSMNMTYQTIAVLHPNLCDPDVDEDHTNSPKDIVRTDEIAPMPPMALDGLSAGSTPEDICEKDSSSITGSSPYGCVALSGSSLPDRAEIDEEETLTQPVELSSRAVTDIASPMPAFVALDAPNSAIITSDDSISDGSNKSGESISTSNDEASQYEAIFGGATEDAPLPSQLPSPQGVTSSDESIAESAGALDSSGDEPKPLCRISLLQEPFVSEVTEESLATTAIFPISHDVFVPVSTAATDEDETSTQSDDSAETMLSSTQLLLAVHGEAVSSKSDESFEMESPKQPTSDALKEAFYEVDDSDNVTGAVSDNVVDYSSMHELSNSPVFDDMIAKALSPLESSHSRAAEEARFYSTRDFHFSVSDFLDVPEAPVYASVAVAMKLRLPSPF